MNKTLNILYAFLGGAIVGCGAAVLLAPDKGSNVRNKISEKSEELGNKITEASKDVANKVCGLLKKKGIKISDEEVDALVAELAGKED